MTRATAGFRPSADCAPAECARRCRLQFARVAVPRQRGELFAGGGTEQPRQRAAMRPGQLADGLDADLGQPRLGRRSDAPHQPDRQIVQEGELAAGIDDHQPVGLGHLRGDLGQMLGARHADRDRQAEFGPHAAADRGGDLLRRAEQMRAAGDVGKGLVDGDALDHRREIVEHFYRRVAQPLVVAEIAADEDQLRAEFARLAPRHAAAHAEGARLVGGGEHDTAADRDRLAAQRRIEQLLDRGIEGVEIRMQDGALSFPSDRSPLRRCSMSRVCFEGAVLRTNREQTGLVVKQAIQRYAARLKFRGWSAIAELHPVR